MLKKIIFANFIFIFAVNSFSHGAEESGGMPQLNPEFWVSQIFWLILSFGILFIILSKAILPKISANLESRKSQILENVEMADKQRKISEEKNKQYEMVLAGRYDQPDGIELIAKLYPGDLTQLDQHLNN